MGRVALHVLEVEEVLPALRHRPQLGDLVHKLVVLVWNIGVAAMTVFHQNLVHLLAALLHVGAVVKVSHLGCIKQQDELKTDIICCVEIELL